MSLTLALTLQLGSRSVTFGRDSSRFIWPFHFFFAAFSRHRRCVTLCCSLFKLASKSCVRPRTRSDVRWSGSDVGRTGVSGRGVLSALFRDRTPGRGVGSAPSSHFLSDYTIQTNRREEARGLYVDRVAVLNDLSVMK